MSDGIFYIEKVLISQPQRNDKNTINTKNTHERIPSDIGVIIPAILREIDVGKTVKQIAKKHHIPEELSDQITRMYLTHPGVDTEGILRRLGL